MSGFIEFADVTKTYAVGDGSFRALDKVSFSMEKGEVVVILGPSGAGKSTVLNLLGGMDTATSGRIMVDQAEVSRLGKSQLTQYRAKKIGFVFQYYNLIPTLTALENVALMKEVVSDMTDPAKMLAEVGLIRQKHQFPSQLSGGEQQRVAIARAVCKNPSLLLCDEPTGALDTDTGVNVLTLLKNMCSEHGRTVVIVTHNILIAEVADRIIYLKNGKVENVVVNSLPKQISEVIW